MPMSASVPGGRVVQPWHGRIRGPSDSSVTSSVGANDHASGDLRDMGEWIKARPASRSRVLRRIARARTRTARSVSSASSLDGIERELDPGDPNDGNMYETSPEELERRGIELLPSNLLDAIRSLRRDELLREALGRTSKGAYLDSSAM